MSLPGGENAIVPLAKLTDYALSPSHLVGKHKASLFRLLFGLEREDAADLRTALLRAAADEDAIQLGPLLGGQGYRIDFVLRFAGREGLIHSGWFVPDDGGNTTLVTVYPIRS